MSASPATPPAPVPAKTGGRHQNLHAHALWQQQRFFAGFLVAVGLVMTAVLVYNGQILKQSNLIWLLYVPSGLILGGGFLIYRWRSHVRVVDAGVKISTLTSSLVIPFDSIRQVKVQPLRQHFTERRSRMIVGPMKQHIDKNAIFIRVRGTPEELETLHKKLGTRLMNEDTIAVPVPDADSLSWEISPHLPERVGQNMGGQRRKRRR